MHSHRPPACTQGHPSPADPPIRVSGHTRFAFLRGVQGFLLSALLVSSLGQATEIVLGPRQFTAMGVRFAPAQRDSSTTALSLALPARVVIPPDRIRVLSAPAAGMIQGLRVATEQEVRRDQVLARLSSPALLEAQRGLVQALSQERVAEETRKRDEALLAEGIIPAARASASRAQSEEARAVRHEREQTLAMLGVSPAEIDAVVRGELRPPEIDLRAPGGGTVIGVDVAVGQRVEAGMALLRIAQLDRLWLETQVPIQDVAQYHVGDMLVIEGTQARARILQVGKRVVPESQVVEIRAEVGGMAGLRAGATVAVRSHPGGEGTPRWQLPAAALIAGADGPQVYVQSAKGVRTVAVKRVGDTSAGPLVTGALQAGDLIAISGVAALRAAENAAQDAR